MFGIEGDINAGDILVDEGLHPALSLGAIESVTKVAGKGATEIPQVGNQLFQRGFIFGAKFLPGGIAAKENFVFVPAGEGEAAKTQDHFLGVRRSVGANGVWAECDECDQGGRGPVEEKLRFAARHEPGGDIAAGAGGNVFEGFPLRIEFVDFDGEAFIESAETVCEDCGFSFGKNQT